MGRMCVSLSLTISVPGTSRLDQTISIQRFRKLIQLDRTQGPNQVDSRRIIAAATRMKGNLMRSDLIFGALTHVTNRYELCQLASKATRKLHKPNTRLQDTTNEVLDRFKDSVPMDGAAEPAVQSAPLEHRRAA